MAVAAMRKDEWKEFDNAGMEHQQSKRTPNVCNCSFSIWLPALTVTVLRNIT